jgi:PQQ-like domain
VLGNTVWVVWSYHGGNVILHGYDAQTLAQVSSVLVPAIGGVSSNASGVLAAGPGGQLYVAAGDTVAVLDQASGQIVRRIYMPADPASSVAVSPDGSKLYVGTNPAGSLRLLVYNLTTGVLVGSSRMPAGGAGNLVASSGGVWGTDGSGHSQWVWFAPAGDLSRSFRVGEGAGGGLASLPAFSGGAVWVGGSHQLVCADPATGRVRASTAIPADHGTPENFSVVTVLSGGRTYALYQDVATNLSGLAVLTPPAACSG